MQLADPEILTSLDFIKTGVQFPPVNQVKRLNSYIENSKKFDGTYVNDRVLVVRTHEGYKLYKDKIIGLNYYQLDTIKLLGLMFNENPVIIITDKEVQAITNTTLQDIDFWKYVADAVHSSQEKGDGPIGVNPKNGRAYYTNPALVYKVVSPIDINHVTHYVLAHPIYKTIFNGGGISNKHTHTRFIIHERGKYSEIVYTMNGNILGEPVDYDIGEYIIKADGSTVTETGLDDLAVHMLHANKPLDKIYGRSSYNRLTDLVSELEKRITLASISIDKNIESILIVPKNLLGKDELTGQPIFRGEGGMVGLAPNQDKPEFISPDGRVNENDTLIGRLIDEIVRQTEYGKVFLFGDYSSASGEALKTTMKGALDRVSRTIDTIDFTIKTLICQVMQLRGIALKPSDITIQWQDGIGESMRDITDTIVRRYSSGTASLESLLAKYDGLTEEQIALEMERIKLDGGTPVVNIDTKTEEELDDEQV